MVVGERRIPPPEWASPKWLAVEATASIVLYTASAYARRRARRRGGMAGRHLAAYVAARALAGAALAELVVRWSALAERMQEARARLVAELGREPTEDEIVARGFGDRG